MDGGHMVACHFAEQVTSEAAAEAAASQSVIDTSAAVE
jgi:hypothetical protein